MTKLDYLNRITNIILNGERVIVSSRQLDQVIQLQEELADELAIQNSEFSLAALVVLQVFYYMRGQGDSALSVEFSAPALRGEVCEKAQEIWNQYRSKLPDTRFLLPMNSTDEELELLQRALDGDIEAQNDLSHLFESMDNQEAANYWLKEAMAMNEDPDFYRHILDQDVSVSQSYDNYDNEKVINAAPLSTIAEETELLEADTQDSNAETEGGQYQVLEKKEISSSPGYPDAEPEISSEPQDTTLIIEGKPLEEIVKPISNPFPSSAEFLKQNELLVSSTEIVPTTMQDDQKEIVQPDPIGTSTTNETPRLSQESIKRLEMKAEWEESYRLLKAESPMIISTRANKTRIESNLEVGLEQEEDDVYYEAQDVEVIENEENEVEDDLIKFLDQEPENINENNFDEKNLIDSLNDISDTSIDAAVREIKVVSHEDVANVDPIQTASNNTLEKCVDQLSPEIIQFDAEEQESAELVTASSPLPGGIKLSPEEREDIQVIDEEEESARLQTIDLKIDREEIDVDAESPQEADIIYDETISSANDSSSESIITNENSAEFEIQPELPIERIEVAVSSFQQDKEENLADESILNPQTNDTSYPIDIVEAYTQQIDSLSSDPRENSADSQYLGTPLDTKEAVEKVSSQQVNDDDEVILIDQNRSLDLGESKLHSGPKKGELVIDTKKGLLNPKFELQDTLEPLPAVIRERQPAETPSMEILPCPKPAPVNTSAVTKAPSPPFYSMCCSWFSKK